MLGYTQGKTCLQQTITECVTSMFASIIDINNLTTIVLVIQLKHMSLDLTVREG